MSKNLSKYIDEVKLKLNADLLTPNNIRLANLYYLNEQYDECMECCRTILLIYPEYLTAKIIMLKALLKLRFINEADNLFNEIYSRIEGLEIFTLFKEVIEELKKSEPQEKIFYQAALDVPTSFRKFSSALDQIDRKVEEISLNDYISENEILSADEFINNEKVSELKGAYSSFVFPPKPVQKAKENKNGEKGNESSDPTANEMQHFKLKIVTETIAELYANQGNYEEAFEAYQLLLKSKNSDKAKIQSKLTDIEKVMSRKQKI